MSTKRRGIFAESHLLQKFYFCYLCIWWASDRADIFRKELASFGCDLRQMYHKIAYVKQYKYAFFEQCFYWSCSLFILIVDQTLFSAGTNKCEAKFLFWAFSRKRASGQTWPNWVSEITIDRLRLVNVYFVKLDRQLTSCQKLPGRNLFTCFRQFGGNFAAF